MKKPVKIIITIVFLAVLGYSLYAIFFKKTTKTITKDITYVVKKGNIEDSIKVTGTANLVDEQQIRFNQAGKVAKANFKAGDNVKKGDIIAELDMADANATIKQSQLSLSDSEINLQELLKGNDEKDKLLARNTLNDSKDKLIILKNDLLSLQSQKVIDLDKANNDIIIAKKDLENLKTEYQNKLYDSQNQISNQKITIDSKQKDIDLAVIEVGNTKNDSLDTISFSSVDNDKTITNSYNDLRKGITDAEKILLGIDNIFGISDSNKYKNDNFEIYLSGKKPDLKIDVENAWKSSSKDFEKLKSSFNSLNQTNIEQIKNNLNLMYYFYSNLASLSQKASESTINSISSSSLPDTQITSYYNEILGYLSTSNSNVSLSKTDIANIEKLTNLDLTTSKSNLTVSQKEKSIEDSKNSILTMKDNLTSLENSLELTISSYESKIKSSENDIKNKEATLKLTEKNDNYKIQSKNLDIESAKADIIINEENLKLVLNGTTKDKIALARNTVARQKLSLENSKKTLDKYRIEAPFDGIIGQIDFKVGDNIVSDEAKYVYIKNPNLIEITSTVDQLDVVKLKIGQKVRIEFDSFIGKNFEGAISNINSSPKSTSGVTSYEIKITMDKKGTEIYSGMTAKLYIIINSKKDVIVIPTQFIQTKGKNSFVEDSNNKVIPIVVGTATTTDTEVLSGINVGDKIIRKIVITSSSISNSSLFPTGGGNNRRPSSGTTSNPGNGGGFTRPE